MVLYWKESVALIIIDILKNPDLALYFMNILMSTKRDYLDNEARIYRANMAKVNNISLNYARQIDKLNKSIRYFKKNVITVVKVLPYDFIRKEPTHQELIHYINLMYGNSYDSCSFRNDYTIEDIHREILDLENKLVVYDIYDEQPNIHIFDKDDIHF